MSGSRGSTSPNGTNGAARAGNDALALVSPSQPSSLDGELGTAEAAQVLQKSPAWIKRHVSELGGRLVDGAYRFPAVAIERRRTVVERISFGAPKNADPEVGRRAAAVYRLLEDGASHSTIVRELEEPPEFVTRTRQAWIDGYRADRQDIEHRCACGAPSDPATARCGRCHAHSRVLTDAQRALLGGEPLPPPSTCACTGCAATVTVERADHVCTRCRLTIDVRGGTLVVTLAGKTLRTLSVQETRALLAQLVPPTPAAPPLEIA